MKKDTEKIDKQHSRPGTQFNSAGSEGQVNATE